jgi:hypothetical protein
MPSYVWYYEDRSGARLEVICMGDTGDKVARDWQLLSEFERRLIGRERPDPVQNLRILEAMYEEGRTLGVFPLKDPLDGLETDLKIARVINFVREDPHEAG